MDPELPPIKISRCETARREPGRSYFSCRLGGTGERSPVGWLIAVEQDGGVSFARRFKGHTQDVRCQADGKILFSLSAQGLLHELDRDGQFLRGWHARGKWRNKAPPADSTELPIDFMHHTVNVLPNGNFLILDAEARDYPAWPGSTTDRQAKREPAQVVGDVVCELSRDGDLVKSYRMLDILDPERMTLGSRSHYWRKLGFPQGYDWGHANAVGYDAHDDTLLVSLRHQDCIIKIDRATGELRWILGNPSEWRGPWADHLLKPDDGVVWQFHQHDCSAPRPGRVLCFDNGNFRAGAFQTPMPAEQCYSRAVEFEVDEHARTVRQVWAYGVPGADRIFACYQGGARRLPVTGNTFITFGGICFEDGVPSNSNVGTFGCARLLEVTQAGEVVFDVSIDDRGADEPLSFSAFRADHAHE